jgi:hypothetical protein
MTEKCHGRDIVHLGPQISEDGARVALRHTKDHQIQQGILKPVKEGQPLDSTCLSLDPLEDGSFAVQELYTPPSQKTPGPAMVNSPAFQTGWDRIFGNRTVGVA